MKKILAVIPVREKSSRLKNKNIKKLCGHELFLWTYQFAKETKLINNVIISTESKKILNIAKKYGYKNNSCPQSFLIFLFFNLDDFSLTGITARIFFIRRKIKF